MTSDTYIAASPLNAGVTSVLREILADPSIPAWSVAALHGGSRISRMREALDQLVAVQAGAVAIDSPEAGHSLLDSLKAVEPELAHVLTRHVAAAQLLTGLEPGPGRNAILGDIGRGDIVTTAAAVRDWTWDGGQVPSSEHPLATVHGTVEVDDVPSFYDEVLVWLAELRQLVVVPTYRQRLSWAPVPDGRGRWLLTLAGASVHVDDLIPVDRNPGADC